jgi:outer membrane protein assembly factor BamD
MILAASVLGGCALLPEQKDETRNWSADRFYTEASGALADQNYTTAVKYYELLDARYPYGRYSMQGKLDLAYAYWKDGEHDAAIDACDRFIQLYPTSPGVAYAYYLKGVVNFNRTLGFLERFIPTDTSQRDPGAATDAYNDFMEVIKRFPETDYARDARKRVVYLRNNLARNEIYVAEYYMDRGAYLAAANRANYVVENYQRTPAVADALNIMIDAYTRLGMTDLAADAERVLALNTEKGILFTEKDVATDDSLVERLWQYLELDEN